MGIRFASIGAAAATVALIATACSSGKSGQPAGGGGTSAAGGSSASGALLSVRSSPLGSILVDSQGRTVYGFAIDQPGKSNCTGTCVQYWPIVPAPSTLPSSLPGISAKLGEITRSDGTRQLTLDDLPVYTYVGDKSAGMTSGQGLDLSGGLWWVVAPSGKWITTKAGSSDSSSPSSSSSSSNGGGGGGYGGY